MIAVERLHDDWSAQLLGRTPGVFDVGYGPSLGHRHACRLQQPASEILIRRNRFGDRTGAISFSGTDAAHPRTISELHQAIVVEPNVRNVALLGRSDNRRGTRTKADIMHQLAQFLDFGRGIERPTVNGSLE